MEAAECYTKARELILASGCTQDYEVIGIMCFMVAIVSLSRDRETWNICDDLKEGSALAKDGLKAAIHAKV